ncbi:hypothetical protein HBH56_132940 [Parastagonospora nodorum]|uniref:Uncharacterized protein n=2 Tax=Phaeosphaeria nodorum (strain SN15 / ATCC MYA-4574 / FGSC 10173) TaxID=321614 RepID=A0A7U2FCL6_PHANO|nr:hypothetical protein SNOG_11503 [Parastagonospora nodorum SN15]KAH3911301.1 hypothetical protein HBH56_132940 [Parastagonospora nodorum]EAT81211.1 hypothetical protein SNOG_11503 [Parastagonospora nodorum SN15]KAH3927032.1 hypothetical protein HBH54_160290 [Parastagonospora nodorum]KAH4144505.1 hypothetical protein HBH45_026060 [Parastagonospora nodorum]KAH4158977.1 hypothetical protein HBH44_111720 [Parastagonospora nodorum]
MSLQPEPETHPVSRAKAPWAMKAESYLLFLKLKELPQGVYDELEEVWAGDEFGKFKGGLGAVVIVRYSDTPAGPYDELILVPGNFTIPPPSSGPPKIAKRSLRIARIYVSQRTTTYNGRLNWNIPKHLARFSFSAPPATNTSLPQTLDVRVFPPNSTDGDGTKPFFSCTLTPWRWVPAIPVNMAYVPMSMVLTQPPCPQAAGQRAAVESEMLLESPINPNDISEKNEEAVLVGTERWCATELGARSWARGCWVETHAGEEVEEGKWWPKGVRTWGVGGWLEDGVFEFPEAVEWKL